MSQEYKTRCGFASILGLPNAGKSTLVNALVGSKVTIVSAKAQTTRCRVLGIMMHEIKAEQKSAQVILMDTPGVFEPRKAMERAMVKAALDTLDQADVVIHLVDATRKNAAAENRDLREQIGKQPRVFLVLNKIDDVDKKKLLALSADLNAVASYQATYMISALKKQGLEKLASDLAQAMPEGPFLFDPDQTTDMPMRFLAAEITREKIFQQLYQELPYAALVETETWETLDDGSIRISQAIHVNRDSQKAIILGKGGSRIKKIGQEARLELEQIMSARVHLKLFVRVQEDWSENLQNFEIMGLDKKI